MKMRRKGNGPASEDAVVLDEVQESEAPEKVLATVVAGTGEETAEVGSSSSGVSANGAGAGVGGAAAPGAEGGSGASGAPRPRKGMLGQLLVKRGLVTDEQIATALSMQSTSGKRLGELLVDIGALDERTLVEALADYFDMPVTHLRRDAPDPAALALVPEQLAREHLAIPVHLDGEGLRVAVAQPSDDLRFLSDRDDRALGSVAAGAAERHPLGHRPQLPGHRWRQQDGAGLRGRRGDPQA